MDPRVAPSFLSRDYGREIRPRVSILWSAALGQAKGRRFSFHSVIRHSTARGRSATLRSAPTHGRFVVSFENQRSTRLFLELEVGVKWKLKR